MQYCYKAYVTEVYDGDTITVDIDLGFCMWIKKEKIRLYGIDAPELRGESREEGLKSRNWLREQILNKEIVLETIKDKREKYGRMLGRIFINDIYINDEMIAFGLAIKAPW